MPTTQHEVEKPVNEPKGMPDLERSVDVYFSADVETDGPIPGPFSILSFALVYAGAFDGHSFRRPEHYEQTFYKELKPISDTYDPDALRIKGLDRERLRLEGESPELALTEAAIEQAEVFANILEWRGRRAQTP